jgi:hypothetical protein
VVGLLELFDPLRVEGRSWNHKHVHRVYCALWLNLPTDHAASAAADRQPLTAPPVLNQTWALGPGIVKNLVELHGGTLTADARVWAAARGLR